MEYRTPREEFRAGSRQMFPILLGAMPFGLVAGVAAVASGLTPVQGVALSVFAFSGVAQLITCQLLASDSPLPVIVAAAFVVSLRLMMYSAALAPHVAHLDRRWRALIAYVMTDQSFANSLRHYGEPGDARQRHWFFLGAAATLYTAWQVSVVVGVIAGASVPSSWSLDFAVTLSFVSLLVPAVRTRRDLAVAIVAAAVALAAAGLPYKLALVVASIAGIAAGIALDLRRPAP